MSVNLDELERLYKSALAPHQCTDDPFVGDECHACSTAEANLRAAVNALPALLSELRAAREVLDDVYEVLGGIKGREFLQDDRHRAFQMQGKYDGAMSEECKQLFRRQQEAVERLQRFVKDEQKP